MTGTLYLVATPIGNLEDFSLRAQRILQNVAVIFCEDTRHSRYLCDHFAIDKPLHALHKHNEQEASNRVIAHLLSGEDVAYISDAGTPVVADPGAILVKKAQENGIKISPIPGASAVMSALSASGLLGNQFVFAGFIPAKGQADFIRHWTSLGITTIFFETPHRLQETFTLLAQMLASDRICVVAREISKTFEEIVRVRAGELLDWLEEHPHRKKGEFVLLIEGKEEKTQDSVWQEMASTLYQAGLGAKETSKFVAQQTGGNAKQIYNFLIHKG